MPCARYTTVQESLQDRELSNRGVVDLYTQCFGGSLLGIPLPDGEVDGGGSGNAAPVDVGVVLDRLLNCSDVCVYANDGECQDGYQVNASNPEFCVPGTDCTDCGGEWKGEWLARWRVGLTAECHWKEVPKCTTRMAH